MKKLIALLLALTLLTGCAKALPEETPEEPREIVPEAAISIPCLNLRVSYETDTGFVGLLEAEPGSHIRDGKEINVVIEDGVEVGRWVNETTCQFFDAMEVIYEPGMLVEVQFTGLSIDTLYPELLYILEEADVE